MENRRYYARKAAELHKQRTGRRLKVTDDAIPSGVFHEEAENDLQKLSARDEAATKPCGNASAAPSISPTVAPEPTPVALTAPN